MHCWSVSLTKNCTEFFVSFFFLISVQLNIFFVAHVLYWAIIYFYFFWKFKKKSSFFFSMLCAATLANHGHFLHLYCALHNAWFYIYIFMNSFVFYHGLTIILFPHSNYCCIALCIPKLDFGHLNMQNSDS